MNIIKSFADHDFINDKFEEPQNLEWYWGLDDTGNLCCKSTYYSNSNGNKWRIFSYTLGHDLSIKDMKKIVKEFGHLLVFL